MKVLSFHKFFVILIFINERDLFNQTNYTEFIMNNTLKSTSLFEITINEGSQSDAKSNDGSDLKSVGYSSVETV